MSRFQLRTYARLSLLDPAGREEPTLSTRPRKLALLAWLALRPHRSATRAGTVGVFWGERDERRARNSLSDALSHLRRVLGPDALAARGTEIIIADDAPLTIDALELAAAAAAGDHERVVELYTGPFLDGFHVDDAPEFDDWRDRERARFARMFAQSARVRCAVLSQSGSVEAWRELAQRWLSAEPACTDAALSWLSALKAPATRAAWAETLSGYESLTRRLERDFGIAPDSSVTAVAQECTALLAAAPPALTGAAAGPSPRLNGLALQRHTVGRSHECAALRECWERAAAGNGLLVSVSGEPGIGKTTLVEEFLSELALDAHTPRVARGRCSERLGGSDAYLPILDALDGLLRGDEDGVVAASMKRHAPTWYVNVAATPADAAESGLANLLASSQGRMLRELCALIEDLCRERPVALFFDDLHWSDLSTIDALAYIATRLDALRLLIVVAIRPAELLLSRHAFAQLKLDLQARGLCRELALEFLSADAVAQFIDQDFPDHALPADFAQIVHARTEGNPLFMTDLVRYLRTQETLSVADGRWRITVPLSDIAQTLPESIRGMIQRKIEQLSDADRRLLVASSVQGYQFDTAIVARLIGSEPADVEERLEPLERIHAFVRRSQEHQLPNGALNVRYRFVHVLYQNAMFASLAPSRRASLSGLAAAALLDAYGEASADIAVELAKLYETAHDAARAADQLRIAAETAMRLFANQEAVALARRALELTAREPESDARHEREARLLTTLGVAHGAIHGLATAEAGSVHARAYALWKQLGSRPDLFSVAGALFTYHIVASQLDIALAIGNELLQLSEQTGNPAMIVTACDALGISLHHLGEHQQAAEHFARGRDAYSLELRPAFIGLPLDPGVGCIAELSRVLWVLGYPDQAREHVFMALRLAHQINHPESIAFANLFGAFMQHFMADAAGALEFADAVLAVSRERDVATTLAWGLSPHGWALGATGRLEDGIAELRLSLDAQRAAGSEVARPQFQWMLGDLLVRASRYDQAKDAVSEGLDTAARTGDHYWDSELLRLRGDIVLRSGGSLADVEQHYLAALNDSVARQAKSLELRAATSLARLFTDQGRSDEAKTILAPVYAWFTEGFDTPDLVAARALLATGAEASPAAAR